jgi:hypothetical protein
MRALVITLAVLLTATLAGADKKSDIMFWTVSQRYIDLLVLHVPQTDALRLAQLKRAFDDLECKGSHLSQQALAEGRNLICTLPGTSADSILVAAHYEREGKGMSAIENWSGAITLPFLYHALTAMPRRHTFIFAALSGNEGAKYFLRSLTRSQRNEIKAVVALDALGLGPLRFYLRPNGSYPSPTEEFLETQFIQAVHYAGSKDPESSIPGSWLKIDDTREFRFKGIPAILIHSVDWSKRGVPGSLNDTESAIDRDAYSKNYDALCYYVVGLDQLPEQTDTISPQQSSRRR